MWLAQDAKKLNSWKPRIIGGKRDGRPGYQSVSRAIKSPNEVQNETLYLHAPADQPIQP